MLLEWKKIARTASSQSGIDKMMDSDIQEALSFELDAQLLQAHAANAEVEGSTNVDDGATMRSGNVLTNSGACNFFL